MHVLVKSSSALALCREGAKSEKKKSECQDTLRTFSLSCTNVKREHAVNSTGCTIRLLLYFSQNKHKVEEAQLVFPPWADGHTRKATFQSLKRKIYVTSSFWAVQGWWPSWEPGWCDLTTELETEKLATAHIAQKSVLQLFFGFVLCFFFFIMRKCESLALPLSASHSWLLTHDKKRKAEAEEEDAVLQPEPWAATWNSRGRFLLFLSSAPYLTSSPARFPSLSLTNPSQSSGLFAYLGMTSHPPCKEQTMQLSDGGRHPNHLEWQASLKTKMNGDEFLNCIVKF